MYLDYYRCQGGQRILDIHHGGRVVFSFHFWPWMIKRWRRWKVEWWGKDGRYLDIGPCQLSFHLRRFDRPR